MLHNQSQQVSSSDRNTEPNSPPAEPVDIFLTHVPANLRAKFGKTRCRTLLADEAKVQLAWNRLLAEDSPQVAPNRRPPQRLPPLHDDRRQQHQPQPIDWYAMLSEQFNSDYSPGVTATRRLGHNRETHGGAVFGPEAGAYNEDNWRRPHRLRKDEFSAYNEIIHVERKFYNQWQTQQAAHQSQAPLKRPTAPPQPVKTQLQQQQQQQASASILSSSSGKANIAKQVTIEDQRTVESGPGDKLQRANTVQQRED